jgi:GTPase KRas
MKVCCIIGSCQCFLSIFVSFPLTNVSHTSEGQAFALVYSVASRATFERVESFRKMLMNSKQYNPFFLLVANKIDKFCEREVSAEEGQMLAEKLGCQYIETSAKTCISVQKVFFDLVRMLRGSKSTSAKVAALPDSEDVQVRQKGKCVVM